MSDDRDGESLSGRYDVRPIPDPTLLTTQQLFRELATLERLINARLDAMDKAVALLHEQVGKTPSEIDLQVSHLKELHDTRMRGLRDLMTTHGEYIQKQFVEKDAAVAAALAAQQTATSEHDKYNAAAIEKSELATAERIKGLETLFGSTIAGIDNRIGEAREENAKVSNRVTVIESRGAGYSASWTILIAVIGVLIGVGGIILAVTKS